MKPSTPSRITRDRDPWAQAPIMPTRIDSSTVMIDSSSVSHTPFSMRARSKSSYM